MADPFNLRYRVVDVFTKHPLEGNALAVFLNPDGLDGDTMQRIAKELNLAESVFVFPPTQPDGAALLRIFTPAREIPFAGHPTVGTSFVLLDEGIVPKGSERFVLEEKIGPVPIRVEQNDGELIWLTTPPISYGSKIDKAVCARMLGLGIEDLLDIEPQIVTAGNPNLFIALKTKAAVDRASADLTRLREMRTQQQDEWLCNFIFTPTPDGAYSRMFAPEHGITEDPATGSATGPLASYMLRHKLLPDKPDQRYVSEQGVKMGRRSLLYIQISGDGGAEVIEVGGYVAPLIQGVMTL